MVEPILTGLSLGHLHRMFSDIERKLNYFYWLIDYFEYRDGKKTHINSFYGQTKIFKKNNKKQVDGQLWLTEVRSKGEQTSDHWKTRFEKFIFTLNTDKDWVMQDKWTAYLLFAYNYNMHNAELKRGGREGNFPGVQNLKGAYL